LPHHHYHTHPPYSFLILSNRDTQLILIVEGQRPIFIPTLHLNLALVEEGKKQAITAL
jgi:hypothetical protein